MYYRPIAATNKGQDIALTTNPVTISLALGNTADIT